MKITYFDSNSDVMKQDKSQQLFEKAKTLMPGGVNSPVRAFKSVGGTPVFMKKGKGAHIWDEDGNEYVDHCCSWGPLILGHANDEVETKIIETIKSKYCYSKFFNSA